jgi:aldehyde:ferredoxin oxidoreductase
LEIAYHDPRAFLSMAVNYATASRGGCHLESLSYWNGYGVHHPDLDYQNFLSVYNPLGLCKFIAKGLVGPERIAQIVNSGLGWSWTAEDVLTTGERLFQLKRLINLRLGVTAADDTLPKRLLTEPRPSGDAAGVLPDLEVMLPVYYRLRDWDQNGVPRQGRLEKLGLL